MEDCSAGAAVAATAAIELESEATSAPAATSEKVVERIKWMLKPESIVVSYY